MPLTECPVCGLYATTYEARLDRGPLKTVEGKHALRRYLLNYWHTRGSGSAPTPIFAYALQGGEPTYPGFVWTSIEEITNAPRAAVPARLDHALLRLSQVFENPGAGFQASQLAPQAPLYWAKDESEMRWALEALSSLGYLKLDHNTASISARGWERAGALSRGALASASPPQAFVAAGFNPHFKQVVYPDGVKPAITAMGYASIVMFEHEHNGLIDDEIIVQIRRSRFVVAELTHANAGAYYEAGYAQALDMPVIYCVSQEFFDASRAQEGACTQCNQRPKIHFDVEHRSLIIYETAVQLQAKLSRRIEATIGRV